LTLQKTIGIILSVLSFCIGFLNLYIIYFDKKYCGQYNIYLNCYLLFLCAIIMIFSIIFENDVFKMVQIFPLYIFACISSYYKFINTYSFLMLALSFLLLYVWGFLKKGLHMKVFIFFIIYIIASCHSIEYGWRMIPIIFFFSGFGFIAKKIYKLKIEEKIEVEMENIIILNNEQLELLHAIKDKMKKDSIIMNRLLSIVERFK